MSSSYMQEIKAKRRAGLRRLIRDLRDVQEDSDVENTEDNLRYIFNITWPLRHGLTWKEFHFGTSAHH